MKRVLAAVLAGLLACPGCAVPLAGRHGSPLALRAAIAGRQQGQAVRPSDIAVWQRYLGNLPVGSRVKVVTADGRSFKAVFMGLNGDYASFNPRTRIPEPLLVIPIASLAVVELDQGTNVGKAIAIGAGAAGATVLGVLLILIAAMGD